MLRRTQSLCPLCLRRLDAFYAHSADGRTVELCKSCPEHGRFRVAVWQEPEANIPSAPAFAGWTRPKSPSYPQHPATELEEGCPFDCGLCPVHGQHTCTGLIEVTLRCNMACPLCYASAGTASPPSDPTLADIGQRLDALKRASGACNVQISGGEPTVRDDLPGIFDLVRQRGFGLVQLNTNGLRLAQEADYAATLADAGLESVYLQWDAVSDAAFRMLRGRDCLDFKRRAVVNCARAGLGVVLVATVVRDVNDHELGALLRLALELGPAVRGLHLQPAAFFGRYPWPLAEAPRLTLAEIMNALARQAPELVRPEHLRPPACEHELCSFNAAYRRVDGTGKPGLEWLHQGGSCCDAARPLQQLILPLPTAAEGSRAARRFVALHWRGQRGPAPADGAGDAFDRFLAQEGVARHFTLSGMAFQDALSLDLDRVRGCCIHVVRPDGRLIPFCLHNLTAAGGTRLYPL